MRPQHPSSSSLRVSPAMASRGWALAALLAGSCSLAHAEPPFLVSEQEAADSRAAPARLEPRTVPVPGAPRIQLLAPDLNGAVPSPTRIQVKFEPGPASAINPETFRVRYGAFKLDITSRIIAAAKVTPDGIDVSQAALPKGSHRLFIEIQDSMGRAAERRVDFTVQ